MDLVRLGPAYSTSYVPDVLIEGYSSLIWTERKRNPGEFELKSTDVDRLRALIPEDCLISHLETEEVMVVETHEIGTNEAGDDEITITGRSFDIIFEQRMLDGPYQKKRRLRRAYSATSAACVLMVNAVDNTSGKDLTRGDSDADSPELNDYAWSTRDAVPNIVITESVASEGAVRNWNVEKGALYPQLMTILEAQNLGIRTLRPKFGSSGTVITVRSALAARGEVVRTANPQINALRLDIFSGVDRRGSVVFNYLHGHVKNRKYLFSSKDYKTSVDVKTDVIVNDVSRNATEAGYTGLRRKVAEYDAGSAEIPAAPEKPDELRKNATKQQREERADAMDRWQDKYARWKNKRARILADFREEVANEAQGVLRRSQRTYLFSGDIAENAPYIYKVHYNLGDLVTLNGDYREAETMVVEEYTRTEDATGERGFPTLATP